MQPSLDSVLLQCVGVWRVTWPRTYYGPRQRSGRGADGATQDDDHADTERRDPGER